jgi:signal transduction histidine kinase
LWTQPIAGRRWKRPTGGSAERRISTEGAAIAEIAPRWRRAPTGYRGTDRRGAVDRRTLQPERSWIAAGLLLCALVFTLVWIPLDGETAVIRAGALSAILVLSLVLAVAAQLYWRTTGEAAGCVVSTAGWLLTLSAIAQSVELGDGAGSAAIVWSLPLHAAGWIVWAAIGPDVDARQHPGRQLLVAVAALAATSGLLLVASVQLDWHPTGTGSHHLVAVVAWSTVAILTLRRAIRSGSPLMGGVAWMAAALSLSAAAAYLARAQSMTWYPLAMGLAVVGLLVAVTAATYGLFMRATARRDRLHRTAIEHRQRDRDLTRLQEEQAHEVRTAILAIEGATLTLQRNRDRLDREQQQKLDDAVKAGIRHLRELVAATSMTSEPLPLFEVVDQQAALLRARGATVTVRGDATLQAVAERTPVIQVLTNLLTNAERHGSGSNGEVQVSITVTRDGDTAVVRVEDAGPGVPAADRSAIFERAKQGRDSGPGDGLGLYLSRELARSQRGDLRLTESSDGEARGAVFVLSLPVRPARGGHVGALLHESEDRRQIIEPARRPSVGPQQRAASLGLTGVVEDDGDIGTDRGRIRGDDGDVVGGLAGVRRRSQEDRDVGEAIEQRPKTVRKQWRRR